MAKDPYEGRSSEELEAEMIRRVNEKDEYLAAWKAEHRPLQAAHEAALEREMAERAAAQEAGGPEPQVVSPEGIESEEGFGG